MTPFIDENFLNCDSFNGVFRWGGGVSKVIFNFISCGVGGDVEGNL